MDHHQGSDGSDYVRFVFGKRPKGVEDWKMDDALDAEFLFLAGAYLLPFLWATNTLHSEFNNRFGKAAL